MWARSIQGHDPVMPTHSQGVCTMSTMHYVTPTLHRLPILQLMTTQRRGMIQIIFPKALAKDAWGLALEEPGHRVNWQLPKPSEGYHPAPKPLGPQEVALLWHIHRPPPSPRFTLDSHSQCHPLVTSLGPASAAPRHDGKEKHT